MTSSQNHLSRPRIVATDLDGTLLRRGAVLSDRTLAALRLVREAGAEIVFVTARAPRGVDQIAANAGVSGTAICSNGAIVYDLAAREIVETRALAADTARKVGEALLTALPGAALAVETGREVLFEPRYGTQDFPDQRTQVSSVWESEEPIVKLLVRSAEHDVEDMFTAAVAAVEGQAEVTHSGGRGLLEISAAGVTKAGTLAGLCERRGVSPAEVVAFGDMPNDLAVLAFAGSGYAMANSHPAVLAAVERHTLSNEEDGVAVVLERLFAP